MDPVGGDTGGKGILGIAPLLRQAEDNLVQGRGMPHLDKKHVAKMDLKKATETAQDFEAVFMSQMIGDMFKDVPVGMFGGGFSEKIWRKHLYGEFGKTMAKGSPLGVARQVLTQIMNIQGKTPQEIGEIVKQQLPQGQVSTYQKKQSTEKTAMPDPDQDAGFGKSLVKIQNEGTVQKHYSAHNAYINKGALSESSAPIGEKLQKEEARMDPVRPPHFEDTKRRDLIASRQNAADVSLFAKEPRPGDALFDKLPDGRDVERDPARDTALSDSAFSSSKGSDLQRSFQAAKAAAADRSKKSLMPEMRAARIREAETVAKGPPVPLLRGLGKD